MTKPIETPIGVSDLQTLADLLVEAEREKRKAEQYVSEFKTMLLALYQHVGGPLPVVKGAVLRYQKAHERRNLDTTAARKLLADCGLDAPERVTKLADNIVVTIQGE